MSIWKLIYELDYWHTIGIASDIVDSPGQRPEYRHLVTLYTRKDSTKAQITRAVLMHLKREAELPFWKQKTFWRLLWLKIVGR